MHTLNQCFSIHNDEKLSSGKAKDGAPWEEMEALEASRWKHCSFQKGLSETKAAVERLKGEVAESSIQRHHEALLRTEPLN